MLHIDGVEGVIKLDGFMIESLRNELINRGITLHKAAKLTGIRYEVLRRSFNGKRELRARELISILEKTGIQFEKLIYKAPEETGIKIVEWNEEELMSKEFALSTVKWMWRFCRRLYFQPKTKPFSGEEDYAVALKQLNGLKEFIEAKIEV